MSHFGMFPCTVYAFFCYFYKVISTNMKHDKRVKEEEMLNKSQIVSKVDNTCAGKHSVDL